MKKIVTLAVMGVVLFALCSGNMFAGGKKEAKPKTTLVLGTSADYPPYEFIILNAAGQQEYAGIDVSLAKALATDTGLSLEVVNMSFDNLIASLGKGEVDVVIAAMEVSEERALVASFSSPYFQDNPALVLVRAAEKGNYTSFDSFNGKTVGAQSGTTKATLVSDNLEGAELLTVSLVPDLVNNLVYNKIDAVVLDAGVAQQYANLNDDVVIADIRFDDPPPYVAVVQKGDPKKLLESFNKTIARVTKDGTVERWTAEAGELSEKAIE